MSTAPNPIPRDIRAAPSAYATRPFGDLSRDALSRLSASYVSRHLATSDERKEIVVVVYTRYSQQLPSLTSEDRQLMVLFPCLQFIKPDKIIFIQEPSRSGADRTREGLAELTAIIRARGATHVLIENVDRLARIESVAHHVRELAEHFGVELWDPLGLIDPDRFSDEARRGAASRAMIAQRSAGSRNQKVLKGLWPSTKPFGWVRHPEDGSDVVKHPESAQRVLDMFKMADGGATSTLITREMTRLGVYPPAQMRLKIAGRDPGLIKPWAACAVDRILSDEKYKGVLCFGKTKIVHDFDDYNKVTQIPVLADDLKPIVNANFEIVPPDLFDRVHASRARIRDAKPKRTVVRRLMRETFCSCGTKLRWHKDGVRLHCTSCRTATLPEAGLEAIAIRSFVLENVSRVELGRVRRAAREEARSDNIRNDRKRAELEAGHRDLVETAVRLHRSDADAGAPPGFVKAATQRVVRQAAGNRAALAALPMPKDEFARHLDTPEDMKRTLMTLLGTGCIRADTIAGKEVHDLFASTFARFIVTDLGGERYKLEAVVKEGGVRLKTDTVVFTTAEMLSVARKRSRPIDHQAEEMARSFCIPEDVWSAVEEHLASILPEGSGKVARLAFEGLVFAMEHGVPHAKLPSAFPSEACASLRTRLDRARAWHDLQRCLERFDRGFDARALNKAVARATRITPSARGGPSATPEDIRALRAAAAACEGVVAARLNAVADNCEGLALSQAGARAGLTKQALSRWVRIYDADGLPALFPQKKEAISRIDQRTRKRLSDVIRDGRDPRDPKRKLTLSRLIAYCAIDLDLHFRNESAFRYAAAKAKLPRLREGQIELRHASRRRATAD